ncbi:2'-5' RNA ligase family protein [Streptomyces avidinii]|uniref:2'-5' RNA ligase family protein n=1 Tax=Streptomyces avidinii TaxID=1895 RepID=UPI003795FCAE
MLNHWDRPGWSDATRAYYWLITIPADSALVPHAQHCQRTLRHLAFDDIADDGLHLTLARVGSVRDVAADELATLAAVARQTIRSGFTLQAVPLTASRGALRYSVAPWKPVLELHAALTSAGAAVGLPPLKRTAVFRPHIGIAYCNRRLPAASVRDRLLPLRDMDPVAVPINEVHLVELRREERAYLWEVVHTLTLDPAL